MMLRAAEGCDMTVEGRLLLLPSMLCPDLTEGYAAKTVREVRVLRPDTLG